MNFTKLFTLFVSVVFLSCDNVTPQVSTRPLSDLKLDVTINGAPNEKVRLLGVYGDQHFMADSATTDAKGHVVFKKDTILPTGMYFVFFPKDNSNFQVLIDREDLHAKIEVSRGNYVNTFKTSNSLNNELLYRSLKFEQDITPKFNEVKRRLDAAEKESDAYRKIEAEQDALIQEREDYVASFEKDYPNTFFTRFKIQGQNPKLKKPLLPDGELDVQKQVCFYRKEFWDNFDFSSVDMLRTAVFHNKLKKYIKDITPQNPDSVIKYADILLQQTLPNKELFKYAANFIALQYQKPTVMGIEAVYVHMIDKYWTPELAFWSNPEEIKGLRKEMSLMKPSLLGKTGQDLRAKNENDQYISMYDIKAPIIVLYLFKYDCDNCQKESPKVVKMYNEWKNKGVDVFTLCLNDEKEEWKQYLKKTGMSVLHNIMDPKMESDYGRKYHIDDTPEMFVLNQERKIIASNAHADQLPDIFEREFEKNPWGK